MFRTAVKKIRKIGKDKKNGYRKDKGKVCTKNIRMSAKIGNCPLGVQSGTPKSKTYTKITVLGCYFGFPGEY